MRGAGLEPFSDSDKRLKPGYSSRFVSGFRLLKEHAPNSSLFLLDSVGSDRCRANMAHIRHSGLGFQLRFLEPFKGVSSSIGSDLPETPAGTNPPEPHESTQTNRMKWRFRGFVWQWGLLFANSPLSGLLRDHSHTNP